MGEEITGLGFGTLAMVVALVMIGLWLGLVIGGRHAGLGGFVGAATGGVVGYGGLTLVRRVRRSRLN